MSLLNPRIKRIEKYQHWYEKISRYVWLDLSTVDLDNPPLIDLRPQLVVICGNILGNFKDKEIKWFKKWSYIPIFIFSYMIFVLFINAFSDSSNYTLGQRSIPDERIKLSFNGTYKIVEMDMDMEIYRQALREGRESKYYEKESIPYIEGMQKSVGTWYKDGDEFVLKSSDNNVTKYKKINGSLIKSTDESSYYLVMSSDGAKLAESLYSYVKESSLLPFFLH